MKTIILSTSLILALVGCGGSSSNDSNPTKEYQGALAQGDYATYTFNSSTMVLNYSIDPDSFYFPGNNGSVTLTNPYGKFYRSSSPTASMMIANNILIGRVPISSTSYAYVAGLQNSSTPTTSAVVGTYIYAHITSTNNIELNTITVNSNGTFNSTNITSGGSSSGCWQISGGRIQAESVASNCSTVTNFDYNVVIKPGSSRSGMVVDYAQSGNGIGIGLKQVALTNSDIVGTYESYYYTSTTDGFAKAEIDNLGNISWYNCGSTGSCPSTPNATGSVALNQDCNNNTINGLACVTMSSGDRYLAFIDNEDNYIISVSDPSSPTPFHIEVGAK